jgi:hypothetical protein
MLLTLYQKLVDETEKGAAGRSTAPDPEICILFVSNEISVE